jgi:hypothetical protein
MRFFISSLLVFVFFGCQDKESVRSVHEIGDQVIGVLREMDKLTQGEFSQCFASAHDIHTVANNNNLKLDSTTREQMKSVTKGKLKMQYRFMFRRLKRGGRNLGVKWADIEKVSFALEPNTSKGGAIYHGRLIFKSKAQQFELQTSSMYDGKKYVLLSIHSLEEYHKNRASEWGV